MIDFKTAKNIILEKTTLLNSKTLGIKKLNGRILAQNIRASFPMPRFDNSAMDGFAVRSEDTLGAKKNSPVTLKLVGSVAAGDSGNISIGEGECALCMTGAPIPKGADSVVMVEDTDGYGSKTKVKIFNESFPLKHIRKKGEEIQDNELLIKARSKISPSEIGTIAAYGIKKARVFRKARVSLFATGDELISPGKPIVPGKIYNSNSFVFSELSLRAGAKIVRDEIIKDRPNSLRRFLSNALKESDIVITSGGVSMGNHDYVRSIFMELGVDEHFWKVAQKPGKPIFFGSKGETLIFGLPGNPVSSYIGFMELVWPSLEKMMGNSIGKKILGVLAKPFPREIDKTRFLFGKVWLEDGKVLCAPSIKVGSHMLSSSLNSNCILHSDPGPNDLQPGDLVKARILPWKLIQ
tara:strand:+ start:6706 stop:7929 length:1224 start_codon:yes stop_codon:yes gene_type:complete